MRLFSSAAPSSKQRARLEKIRAKGRKHFIIYTGVLGWGLSVFVITTIWGWYDDYRWHFPTDGTLLRESVHSVVRLAIFLTLGYFFGARMWKRFGFQEPNAQSPTTPQKT
jgi:hypothetical protein